MKETLTLAFAFLFSILSFAQVKSGDADLDRRLAEYLQANEQKDFETVMDYMHPNLFKIVPKQQMIDLFKQTFSSPEMAMEMSDLGINSVSKPFIHAGSAYRKALYRMTIRIRFADSSVTEGDGPQTIVENFKAGFPGKSVTYDADTKSFVVKGEEIMFAIRNPGKPWLFLGYKDEPALLRKLFPAAVITHFKM